jgi:hypothetical protein
MSQYAELVVIYFKTVEYVVTLQAIHHEVQLNLRKVRKRFKER